jgi:hypothetical protein
MFFGKRTGRLGGVEGNTAEAGLLIGTDRGADGFHLKKLCEVSGKKNRGAEGRDTEGRKNQNIHSSQYSAFVVITHESHRASNKGNCQ